MNAYLLVKKLSDKSGISLSTAHYVMVELFSMIRDFLENNDGQPLIVNNFGTFFFHYRKPRIFPDLYDRGCKVFSPATRSLAFRPDVSFAFRLTSKMIILPEDGLPEGYILSQKPCYHKRVRDWCEQHGLPSGRIQEWITRDKWLPKEEYIKYKEQLEARKRNAKAKPT